MTRLWQQIRDALAGAAPVASGETDQHLRLAFGALLLEMARADFNLHPSELSVMAESLQQSFGLTRAQTRELLEEAESDADVSVSLQQYTSLLNEHLEHEEKLDLLQRLWAIAEADGEVHHLEEMLFGRVGELLHVAPRLLAQIRRDHGT